MMHSIAIQIENLRVKFPDKQSFLFKDLSLTIQKGEKVLIVGPSGSGKSTLLKILAKIIPKIVEVPCKYDNAILPVQPGYVFQNPDHQFCMPYVDEEMAFVLENQLIHRDKMKLLIREYLDLVGLTLPSNHTLIDHLSGGMKQRLAIASVLALQPDVLFLDEPTAMLDQEGTNQVWDTVWNISQNKTLIVVEHKIDRVIDYVDRMIMIDDCGNIIADGNPHTLLRHKKSLFQQYGIWYPNIWNDHPIRMDMQPMKNVMEINHASGYYQKTKAIRIEHAQVNEGDFITISGHNGAGKSTLLQMLAKLIKYEGRLHLPLLKNKRDFYKYVGYVFQNPELQFVANNVYEELEFSISHINNHKERMNRIEEHLAIYELGNWKEAHPYQLSIGQMKRLSVATATIRKPKILLLDEPTFGQDAYYTFTMLDYLKQLQNEATTIIMVTHDYHITTHYANKIWYVQNGVLTDIVENGIEDANWRTIKNAHRIL